MALRDYTFEDFDVLEKSLFRYSHIPRIAAAMAQLEGVRKEVRLAVWEDLVEVKTPRPGTLLLSTYRTVSGGAAEYRRPQVVSFTKYHVVLERPYAHQPDGIFSRISGAPTPSTASAWGVTPKIDPDELAAFNASHPASSSRKKTP